MSAQKVKKERYVYRDKREQSGMSQQHGTVDITGLSHVDDLDNFQNLQHDEQVNIVDHKMSVLQVSSVDDEDNLDQGEDIAQAEGDSLDELQDDDDDNNSGSRDDSQQEECDVIDESNKNEDGIDVQTGDEIKDENEDEHENKNDDLNMGVSNKNNSEIKPRIFKNINFGERKNDDNNNNVEFDADTFAIEIMKRETGGNDPDSLNTWLQSKYQIYNNIKHKKDTRSLTAADASEYREYQHIVWFSANRVVSMRYFMLCLLCLFYLLCYFFVTKNVFFDYFYFVVLEKNVV